MKSPSEPPRCFNREPRLEGYWRHGVSEEGEIVRVWVSSAWSKDECKVHAGTGIGPNGENYPETHGWMPWCIKCRWMPVGMEKTA